MSRGFVGSGILAAALLALGFELVVPLGQGLDAVCSLAGLASSVVFVGLADGV